MEAEKAFSSAGEAANSGDKSDGSTGSKECLSLMSTSWEEESVSDTPMSRACVGENATRGSFSPMRSSPFVQEGYNTERRLSDTDQALVNMECQMARLTLQYQALAQSYKESVALLRQAQEDNEVLRRRNLELQASNIKIAKLVARNGDCFPNGFCNTAESGRFSLSLSSPCQNPFPLHSTLDHMMNKGYVKLFDVAAEDSPTSVFGFRNRRDSFFSGTARSQDGKENFNERAQSSPGVVPKSISIRSAGYLSMKQTTPSTKKAPPTPRGLFTTPQKPHRVRVPAPADVLEGEQDGADIEYDAYNQGMFKTELCNKWQDTGACPYGERCQFAHGVEELRPVIRHPRYKTELCRMVASGEKCPYGHRCHFRHIVTKEDNLPSSSSSSLS